MRPYRRTGGRAAPIAFVPLRAVEARRVLAKWLLHLCGRSPGGSAGGARSSRDAGNVPQPCLVKTDGRPNKNGFRTSCIHPCHTIATIGSGKVSIRLPNDFKMLLRHFLQNFNRPTVTIMFHQLFCTKLQMVRRENDPAFLADTTAERQFHPPQFVHHADLFGDAVFLLRSRNIGRTSFTVQHVFSVFVQLPLVVRPFVGEKVPIRLDGPDVREVPRFTGFHDGIAKVKLVEHHDHLSRRRQSNRLDALGGQLGKRLEYDRFMIVVRLLRFLTILLARPKPNRARHDNISVNERAAEDRMTLRVNLFRMQKDFRHGVHLFRPFRFLRVVEDEVNAVAGFPAELSQNAQRVFEQKLRRIPFGLAQKMRYRLSRSPRTEKFRELAQTFPTADRRNAEDQPPKMSEQGAAELFADLFEKSLAKGRKSVYRKHRILCSVWIPVVGYFFASKS